MKSAISLIFDPVLVDRIVAHVLISVIVEKLVSRLEVFINYNVLALSETIWSFAWARFVDHGSKEPHGVRRVLGRVSVDVVCLHPTTPLVLSSHRPCVSTFPSFGLGNFTAKYLDLGPSYRTLLVE